MTDLERRVGNLETDVKAIRADIHELKNDIAVLKANSSHYATKTDIAEFKAEIHKEFTNQTKWMVATLLTAVGLVFAIQRAFPPQVIVPPVEVKVTPQAGTTPQSVITAPPQTLPQATKPKP